MARFERIYPCNREWEKVLKFNNNLYALKSVFDNVDELDDESIRTDYDTIQHLIDRRSRQSTVSRGRKRKVKDTYFEEI